MAVLTINGRQVTVDDSFRDLSREDQEATVAHIADSMSDDKPTAEPSGPVAAIGHAVQQNIHGVAETAKQLGIGGGKDMPADGYVPANVTNGSANPLNWNWSQVPQKIAESAPGLVQDAAAGALAKAALRKVPYVGKVAPIIGAGVDAFLRTGGDTVNDVAAQHGNAEPTAADKLQGLGTAAAASAVGSVAPTRFIPGANKVAGVGTSGVLDSIKKYLATTAIGAGSSAGSDAVSQLGTKGTIDPSQSIEAAAGGGLTAGALAAPRGAADVVGAARRAQFGGANADATAAYTNRLIQNAGEEGLGNAKRDFAAQENTKAGLKKELQAVDASGMSQDTANALSLAQRGAPLTNDHVEAIEAADPNAGFLARQMRMAQLNEGYGSYDKANKGWSGGLSGLADKYALRPFKSHVLIGGGSALLGHQMLGSYALPTLAGAAAAYGLARGVDNLTGARSPASASATRFADANVPTRLAPPPTPPASTAAPTPPPTTPWGPRPNPTGPTGPQVAPAAPQAQAPPLNPVALNMLKQTLKQNAAAQAPPPSPTPEQQVASQISPIALASLKMRFKENQAAADEAAKQQNADYKAVVNQAFSENRQLDKDFAANQSQAVSENRQLDKNFGANQTQAGSENKARDLIAAIMLRQQDADHRATVTQAHAENRQLDKNFGANQMQAVSENKARDKAEADEAKAAADEAKAQAKMAAAAARTTITKKSGGEVKVGAPAAPAAKASITKKSGGEVKVVAPEPKTVGEAAGRHYGTVQPGATAETVKREAAYRYGNSPVDHDAFIKAFNEASALKRGDAPATDPYAHVGDYTPVPEASMAFRGMTPQQIAQASMSSYEGLPPLSRQALFNSIVGTRTARNNAIGTLAAQHPADAGVLKQLLDQLHQPGHSSKDTSMRAVKHYAGLMSPEGAQATRDLFSRQDVQDTIWPTRKRKTNAKKAESAAAS